MMQLSLQVNPAPFHVQEHDFLNRKVELLLRHEGSTYLVAKAICDPKLVEAWLSYLVENLAVLPPSHLNAYSGATLAEAIAMFYEDASDDLSDTIFEDLFSYRKIHDIRFAFRGCEVPSVIVGVWMGHVTVSWSTLLDIPAHLNGGQVELIL